MSETRAWVRRVVLRGTFVLTLLVIGLAVVTRHWAYLVALFVPGMVAVFAIIGLSEDDT